MFELLVAMILIILVHWVACLVFPLLRTWQFGKKKAFLWAFLCFFLHPLVVIATQWRRIPAPGWIGWAWRIPVAITLLVGLVLLGDSDLTYSDTMVGLRGNLATLVSTETIYYHNHGRLEAPSTNAGSVFYFDQFSTAPFAVVGIIGFCGMCLYHFPVERTLLLSIASFCTSLVFDCMILAQTVCATNKSASAQQSAMLLYDGRLAFTFYLPLVLFFWCVVLWALWDSTRPQTNDE